MVQYIDKSVVKAELEQRKNQFVSQAESFRIIGMEDKESYFTALASNMNSLSCFLDTLEVKEELVSKDLNEAAKKAATWHSRVRGDVFFHNDYQKFIEGAKWQKEYLWKDAQDDDLPEIDREVIVLVKALPKHEDSLLKVAFAHRPPEYWEGKNIITGEITRYKPKRYDKGEWNIPDVKYWIDIDLPKVEE